MKVGINLKVDSEKKKKLIEEAHKRNLTLKEYLRLLKIISAPIIKP